MRDGVVFSGTDGVQLGAASRHDSWRSAPIYWTGALAQEAPRATPTRNPPAARTTLPPRRVGSVHAAALISGYPWPQEQAIAVARCENRELDPSIISDTGDYGIFQINEVHAARVAGDLSRLLIAEVNVRVAYEIWSEEGWVPWRSSRRCHGY